MKSVTTRPLLPFLFLISILLAGCGADEATPLPPPPTLPPPAVTPTIRPLPTATTAVPSDLPTAIPPSPTAIPWPTWTPPATAVPNPPAGSGRFQNLRFATHPAAEPQTIFPIGVSEVFAVWEYTGMNPGDFTQRSWRYNGDNWLNKEEMWDTAVRSSSGVVTDVSIYDKAIGGLAPGEYQLDLFVNGVWQTGGRFTILPRPAAGQPRFSNLYFAASPNTPAQINFPAGTEQIYAIWTYSNMGVSDVVRREWALNGAVWLEREDVWDYFHYGPDGMVIDVSIFDFAGAGLQSGHYSMALSLNGVKQLEQSFTIGDLP